MFSFFAKITHKKFGFELWWGSPSKKVGKRRKGDENFVESRNGDEKIQNSYCFLNRSSHI